MAIQHIESGETARDDGALSQEFVQGLGETGLAQVIPFPQPEVPAARPGMEATMAFVNWIRDIDARGYGKFGIAEYKRDEGGLYVDHHGPKVYLTD
ncbi:hypothetical protein BH09PAT4_BH09PAT4_00980 [soil metagenome]